MAHNKVLSLLLLLVAMDVNGALQGLHQILIGQVSVGGLVALACWGCSGCPGCPGCPGSSLILQIYVYIYIYIYIYICIPDSCPARAQ